MLKRLHVRNFTVFEEADFEFSPGLNVVVGTNGTGKSHVLKLGYAVEMARTAVSKAQSASQQSFDSFGAVVAWGAGLYDICKIFQAEQSGNLIRRDAEIDGAVIEVNFFTDSGQSLKFEILPKGKGNEHTSSIKLGEGNTPVSNTKKSVDPVFIPAKEILTMMPDIIGVGDEFPYLLDSTYTGLARKLTIRPRSEIPTYAQPVIDALGDTMRGTIHTENGRFYLRSAQGELFEIGLVAEGFRKIGTLSYLLVNGSLTPETTLFWDEPEANLNPALLRQLAALLVQLAAQGFQIILATHSLFLLKEFHILAQQQPQAQVRYFGLSAAPGEATRVATADNLELLPDIVALDAELAQSDRFLHVLNQEDAGV